MELTAGTRPRIPALMLSARTIKLQRGTNVKNIDGKDITFCAAPGTMGSWSTTGAL